MRHHAYHLLSRLFQGAPDAALVGRLNALGVFEGVLDVGMSPENAAEYYAVAFEETFGRTINLYESLFRVSSLMVNGAVTGQIRRFADMCGFDVESNALAADHISNQLGLMAHLLEMEQWARDEANENAILLARFRQAQWVHHHIGTWVPVAALTVERVAQEPLYRAVGRITRELVLTEVALHSAAGLKNDADEINSLAMAKGDETSDLAWLVRKLISPAEVGLYVTAYDIRGWARRLEVPLGFGDRYTIVRQLFESAGQFEKVPLLLTMLQDFWRAESAKTSMFICEYPAWRLHAEEWQTKLANGARLLNDLKSTAQDSAL